MDIVDNILAVLLIVICIGLLSGGFNVLLYGLSDPQNNDGKNVAQGCGLVIIGFLALLYNITSLFNQNWVLS